MNTTPWRPVSPDISLSAADRALNRLLQVLPRLPAGVADALAGGAFTNARGDRLDPHTNLLLALERRVGRTFPSDRSVVDVREGMRRSVGLAAGRPRHVHAVEDFVVDGDLPARVYRPGPDPVPWLLYLHGGGWAAGDLATHDGFCRRLCADGRMVVVSLDYRLAPEFPFPAALEDTARAWSWVSARATELGVDPDRGGIGGDSAGGNLSAVLCQQVRDGQVPGPAPKAQLLIYPATDFRRLTDSHAEFGHGFLLESESIDFFLDSYAAPDNDDPIVSPRLHPNLAGLPPAVVVPADFDPLRDEVEAYAEGMAAAGTDVHLVRARGLVHGFCQMDAIVPAADRTNAAIISAMADLLHGG